jgi:phosphatidylglycerol---prolipoprotein diacylglyceryl transferase
VQLAQTAIDAAAIGLGALVSRATLKPLAIPNWLVLVAGALVGGGLASMIPSALHFGGGRDLVFGVGGGYAGVEVARRIAGLHAEVTDGAVVPTALGLAVGRLGCYVAGCCAGTPSNAAWAHDFGDGVLRHPTQLYELAFHVAAALVFWQLARGERLERQRAAAYVVLYFAYRFATDFLRPGAPLYFLTLDQWASLLFALALVLYRLVGERVRRTPKLVVG